MMNKPAALHKGDTIAIISTARRAKSSTLAAASKELEARGYKVFSHPHNALKNHEYAGTFEQRAEAFHDAFRNPDIKAVITAAGGTRTLHLLDYIDFDVVKRHPKIFCGYSDTTALLNSIYNKTGLVGFHGHDAARIANPDNSKDTDLLLELMSGQTPSYDFSSAQTLREGDGEGTLIGGNLCILNYLLGTEFAPSFENAILFIEDEAEEIRNIDRMLLQLKRIGRLDQIKGLMIGGFTMTLNTGRIAFPYDLTELVSEMTEGLNIPIILDAPFGHGDRLMPLPIGTKASLSTNKDTVSFSLNQPAVI